MWKDRSLATLADFYEFTMANGFWKLGYSDKEVVFDMFYRQVPDNGGYVIAAGLEQFIEYIQDLHFTEEDIEYFRKRGIFDEAYLNYLKDFKFTGDIYAVPEGTIVYPNVPLITVVAPICEAQILETMLLVTINHQSLIATKASRIARAAGDKTVMEFGARRAHGYDAAVYGARAAYIGGCAATATIKADELFGIPAVGTMAHSWIQFFDNEYEAFKAYAECYPNDCTLLVDTYDTLKSGVPCAIKVAKEVLEPKGHKLKGIRIDSGDLAYLSKMARSMLDDAGLNDTSIIVSNSIDEHLLYSMANQDAAIDSYGIGERLITAKSDPILTGVYKLVAIKEADKWIAKIKVSDNSSKLSMPGFKRPYRIYDSSGIGMVDVLALHDEKVDKDTVLIEPNRPYKSYHIDEDATIVPLQETIFKDGKLVYDMPSIKKIKERTTKQLSTVWEEEKRFYNPHKHYVDLTEKLYAVLDDLLRKHA